MYFAIKQNTSINPIIQNLMTIHQTLQRWRETHQGPLANIVSNTYAFMRRLKHATIFDTVIGPAAGQLSSNTELLIDEDFVPLTNIPLPQTGNHLTVLTIVILPTSRGSVSLNSSDLQADPLVNPNYLATDFDQHAVVQALKDVFQLLGSEAFGGYVGEAYWPLANRDTDAQLLEYVQTHAQTIDHSVSTAKMWPEDADRDVVDRDVTVDRTKRLRVAAASMFTYKYIQLGGML
jgi:choline dehydrogenase-like flavoprotein